MQGRGENEGGGSTETLPPPVTAALSAQLRARECVGLGAGLPDDSREGRIEGGQAAGREPRLSKLPLREKQDPR